MPDDLNPPPPPAFARRIAQVTAAATRTLLGLILLAMVLLNVANAVARDRFIVADRRRRGAGLSMVWMVMIGMILVTVDQRHIALDFLVNRLSGRPRIALTMFHHAIIAVGASYAALQCVEFTKRVAAIGQTSMALGMPMLFAHSALIVGFGGTAMIAVLLVVIGGAEFLAARSAAKAGSA